MSSLVTSLEAGYREKALKSLGTLPPFSPVLNKLIASLADEDVSFRELADLIEKDTVLAGNVLRMVNSALYGMRGTINSVRHAVSLMGISRLRNTAMSISVAQMWSTRKVGKGWSHKAFNLHSVAAAIAADLMAAELPVEYPEGGFVAGLLQNIGMLLIAISLPEEFQRVLGRYQEGTTELAVCERELLGFDHAALSADVLQHWNLPAAIRKAVANHHGPHAAGPDGEMALSAVVEKADVFAEQQGITAQPWMRPARGLPADTLAEMGVPCAVLEAFHNEFESIRTFFQ